MPNTGICINSVNQLPACKNVWFDLYKLNIYSCNQQTYRKPEQNAHNKFANVGKFSKCFHQADQEE